MDHEDLRRIEADLAQAARVQKDLLPKESPRFSGFDIAGLNVPCYEIGGDYYDFVTIDAHRLGVVDGPRTCATSTPGTTRRSF